MEGCSIIRNDPQYYDLEILLFRILSLIENAKHYYLGAQNGPPSILWINTAPPAISLHFPRTKMFPSGLFGKFPPLIQLFTCEIHASVQSMVSKICFCG